MSLSNFTASPKPEIPPYETPIIVIVFATFLGVLCVCYCCHCIYRLQNPRPASIVVHNPVVVE